jgi:N-acylglucosamine-6-phosphate 2-epimerase
MNSSHITSRNALNMEALDRALKHRLVVSCQPVDGGAMDRDEIVVALARAAIAGGAGGVRIEGVARVAAVRTAIVEPIIGIVKRDLTDSPVRITPFIDDVIALANAGANVIAVDGTERVRPVELVALLKAIHEHGALAMADCSNVDEALAAHKMGFDLVGTTLSGYVGGTVPDAPDLVMIRTLAGRVPRLMAEGRFNTPTDVQNAVHAGAWSVTVGTAITRTEIVTGWFAEAMLDKNA